MRMEVHLHADIPILEGVSRKRIEEALAPLLEYLDAEGLADVKSLEQDEPGLRFDDKELMLVLCWTGEIGRSFHAALDGALENLGPLCYEAVEVELTLYLQNGVPVGYGQSDHVGRTCALSFNWRRSATSRCAWR